ncbi:MAG TPA: hypothetical protein VFS45_03710 [Sphingomicrobium sp.]|nr:hypothetical protein [Sphingomicrobium sp.]
MNRILALSLAAASVLASPLASPALALPPFYAPAGVDQMRAGPFLVTVFEGVPPNSSNARNSLSRGIRVFEKPHRSTFAAVAAQEIFEFDFKARGGIFAQASKAQMEIVSHEIESLVASRYGGFNLAAFEAKEAETLTRYEQLRGMPAGEILARMRAARPVAERWLARNRDVVRALVAYRFPR